MLLSFLPFSVILHPISVTSRQYDFITEKDGNNRKDRNFWIPCFRVASLKILKKLI